MASYIPLHNLMIEGRSDSHAVSCDAGGTIHWQSFIRQVSAQAYFFSTQTELRWLLVSDNALDFSVKLLALMHAGKQVVIPQNSQPGTLSQLADEYDAVVSAEVPLLNQEPPVLSRLDPQATHIDLYTSGSTGKPKRIRKTLVQIETELKTLEALWGERLVDCAIVATVPHHHIYGLLFRVLWPLCAGRVFSAVTCTSPDLLKKNLLRFKKSALVSSPAQLARLPDLVSLTTLLSTTGTIFSSGGPLLKVTASEFHAQLGYDPIEIFGSTESGGIAWRRQCDNAAWQPFAGVKVKQHDGGALLLVSPFLKSKAPLIMGDAVNLLPNGTFHLLGRLDRIVKVEEKRLSLPEMESLLTAHPWIIGSAATLIMRRKQRVGVAVELTLEAKQLLANHGRRFVSQKLRLYLSEYFESVLLPRHWRFVDKLPINAQGKLTHAAVSALFKSDKSEYALP